MTMNERLKELRINKKLTQQDVADMLGVSKGLVSLYESGKRVPGRETLLKLADLYGVSIDYIMQRNNEWGDLFAEEPLKISNVVKERENTDYKVYPVVPLYNDAKALESMKHSSYVKEKKLLSPIESDDMFYYRLEDGGWALGKSVFEFSQEKLYLAKKGERISILYGRDIDSNERVFGEVVSVTYIF